MSNHDMQNMGKKIVALLAILTILLGCKGNGLIPDKSNDEISQNLDELFDSLLWQQYHSPEKTEKTVYEWKWAYDVREAIGVDDLDSLTTLSFELDSSYHSYAASPMAADMTTASEVYAGTARFRMLNVYQSLADLMAESTLGDDDGYYKDYALWEDLFKEFDYWYKDKGNWRFIFLNSYYKHIADLRSEVLKEELALLSNGEGLQKTIVKSKAPRLDQKWINEHQSISRWFGHRMKMADKIQCSSVYQAECIRFLTYKQVSLYIEYQTKAEKEYNLDDDE
jgi:hypothetical protein